MSEIAPLAVIEEEANSGEPGAAKVLACMYLNPANYQHPEVTEPDRAEAEKWVREYRRLLEQKVNSGRDGYFAAYELAYHYKGEDSLSGDLGVYDLANHNKEEDHGKFEDAVEAEKWMHESLRLAEQEAERGDIFAMSVLAEWSFTENNDTDCFLRWMPRSANAGNASACYQLGKYFYDGQPFWGEPGGPVDLEKALEWWTKNVDLGDLTGVMFLKSAAEGGDERAIEMLRDERAIEMLRKLDAYMLRATDN